MKPGRELDALVAEKVMGFEIGSLGGTFQIRSPGDCGTHGCMKPHWKNMPNYSTDIAAAWEVMEKLKNTGMFGNYLKLQWYDDRWICYFDHEDFLYDLDTYPNAPTAPHAICLAALSYFGDKQS